MAYLKISDQHLVNPETITHLITRSDYTTTPEGSRQLTDFTDVYYGKDQMVSYRGSVQEVIDFIDGKNKSSEGKHASRLKKTLSFRKIENPRLEDNLHAELYVNANAVTHLQEVDDIYNKERGYNERGVKITFATGNSLQFPKATSFVADMLNGEYFPDDKNKNIPHKLIKIDDTHFIGTNYNAHVAQITGGTEEVPVEPNLVKTVIKPYTEIHMLSAPVIKIQKDMAEVIELLKKGPTKGPSSTYLQ